MSKKTEKQPDRDALLKEADAIMDKLLGPGWRKRSLGHAEARRRLQAAHAVVEEMMLAAISSLSPAEQAVLQQRLALVTECRPEAKGPLSDAERECLREIEERALRKLRGSVPKVKR